MERNINIIVCLNGEKIVLINDIRFKGRKREDWKEVEDYLKEYVGGFYEIAETSEKIFISGSFPDEYAGIISFLPGCWCAMMRMGKSIFMTCWQ